MTADVPTGLVVVHVRLALQVLAPAAMVQEEDESASVPVAAETTSGAKTVRVIVANLAMPVATIKARRRSVAFIISYSRPGGICSKSCHPR